MAGGKYRSFLIHVKAVNERGTDEICNGGIRPVVRLPSLKHQSNKGYSLASLLAKVAAGKVRYSIIFCCCWLVCLFCFLGPHLRHMQVPQPGVESEL